MSLYSQLLDYGVDPFFAELACFAWSDEAREASLAARRGQHEAKTKIAALKAEHEKLKATMAAKMDALKGEYKAKMAAISAEHDKLKEQHGDATGDLQETYQNAKDRVDDAGSEYEGSLDEASGWHDAIPRITDSPDKSHSDFGKAHEDLNNAMVGHYKLDHLIVSGAEDLNKAKITPSDRIKSLENLHEKAKAFQAMGKALKGVPDDHDEADKHYTKTDVKDMQSNLKDTVKHIKDAIGHAKEYRDARKVMKDIAGKK